ncbi:cysteine peptidase family C39 domain-containing protein [Hallella mizrahii]|uniref:Peptidase C39 domain-containing protein n=1 Tax=Hallella mizrahii TaxID=2606637 RepID=A0A7K0KKQ1_9BACT|nr:cysteine peptidase family C39 domain-containing protein [Hallella mizrahii]MST86020.1 hypothetical protein [Hallella mizrahii]
MSVFPFFKQTDSMMCGITCLKMICKYYGKEFSLKFLSNICVISKFSCNIFKKNNI